MRYRILVGAALVALSACESASSLQMGVSGGGQGGGVGGQAGQVLVGNIFFQSAHNGSQNPAVDTIAAGSTVTWTWATNGQHSIQSTGAVPAIFRNSVVMTASGSTYSVTFNTPGTYTYDCMVHGSAMTGVVVVQ
jgi:plastocyanin